jgi:hypothetical protein
MNEQIKQKWVEALTSGEYKQGRNCLNDGFGGFCCLGVLSDLYAKEQNFKWGDDGRGNFCLDGEIYTTPKTVQAWSGLKVDVPYLPFASRDNVPYGDSTHIMEGDSTSIAALNDEGISFPQIADLIKTFL